MGLFENKEIAVAEAIGRMSFTNPFLPERIELEKRVLGKKFIPVQETWSVDPNFEGENANVDKIRELAATLTTKARRRLVRGATFKERETQIYEDIVLYELYYRFEDRMYNDIVEAEKNRGRSQKVAYFDEFKRDAEHFFGPPAFPADSRHTPQRLFALLFQHRRAFHFTFRKIFGGSAAAARLRAAVWESIFTRDMRRYRRAFWNRMHDVATLITGPSGTGKELVASAIGLSRFVPFNPTTKKFEEDFPTTFHPLNLSALAPNLVESELFGHKKGSFTGAIGDRPGFLSNKPERHTVFLDEIGDVDSAIQLKLLRVLETREFQAIGDSKHERFSGKIIAATNRSLKAAIDEGTFRADLYYRLCSDHIETPSLAEQIAGDPSELENLVGLIVRGIVGPDECEAVKKDAVVWISKSLGLSYGWPGNMRELGQCVRNIVVHGEYRPLIFETGSVKEKLASQFLSGALSADEVLSRYCTLVFAQTGEYQKAGRRLGLDRRTVKSKIDPELLEELR